MQSNLHEHMPKVGFNNALNIKIASCSYGDNAFKKVYFRTELFDEHERDFFFFMNVFCSITAAPPADLSFL